MPNLLLLGEGDFSFSRDLCQILSHSDMSCDFDNVVPTSFDDRIELQKKYSNIGSTISSLESSGTVQVIHGIDATKNIKSQLIERCCKALDFDHIIFNFPHLGYEDLKAHSSLIAHIIHRVHEILSDGPLHGSFYLTLAQSQAENWNLKEMALKNGMICYDEVPFLQQLWPSYQLKRHHSGKSFGTRVLNCIHYCLRVNRSSPSHAEEPAPLAVIPVSTPNLFRQLLKHLIDQKGKGPSNVNEFDSWEVLPADPGMSKKSCDVVINENKASPITKKIPKKRRKVDDMVEGGYIKITALPSVLKSDPGGTESLLQSDLSTSFKEEYWQCKSCERNFKSEQGVKTHVYMMHVLDSGDSVVHDSITGNVPHPLICAICSRVCPNNDALQQHTVAKHSGQFQDIKPSWAMETVIEAHAKNIERNTKSSSALNTTYECLLCSFTFPSSEQLESHLQGWQPLNVSDQLSCEYCQHCFKDERALKQHINHCKRVPILQLSPQSDIKI